MLKLILRQIANHRKVILPIIIFWILGGYFIFAYRDQWFGVLVRWWIDQPVQGTQLPGKAYPYVLSARDKISDGRIDLKLMRKSCQEFLPLRFRGQPADYRPHWLAKLRNWQNLNIEDSGRLDARAVEPDTYWAEHQPTVLLALKDMIDALGYAYEIPPNMLDNDQRSTLLLAAEFAPYAEAVCQPVLARLVWGDYAKFQEERAFLKSRARHNFEDHSVDLRTREAMILRELQGVPEYEHALREYIAGSAPISGNPGSCRQNTFRLPCIAPYETIEVYLKLLNVSDPETIPFLHLNIARTYQLVHRRHENSSMLAQAMQHYRQALLAHATQREALFEITFLLASEKRYPEAYEGLQHLSLQSRQAGFPMQAYRELARRILIGMRRFKDADCFAEMSDLRYGTREHCRQLQL